MVADVITTLFDVLIIVGLVLYWKFVPSNGKLFMRLIQREKEIKSLAARVETEIASMYDLIESHMKPIAQRNRMRANRAKSLEKKNEAEETGGLIPSVTNDGNNN